ncbi:Elongation factor 1-beta [Chionoecetes opilio]|uniref:Elongation factor 1-beta n=1 Tax=Chionoecetes opilio TaxID=41210 RepID=A0A8J5CW60_CHIOP|nr:Elongation factor 1-beta [Chionoecetes opilio]
MFFCAFQVAAIEMMLYSGCAQMDGESAKRMTIGEAVHGCGLRTLGSLCSPAEVEALDHYLRGRSYVLEHCPSQADVGLWRALRQPPPSHCVHASRWYQHMASFTEGERLAFPGDKVSLEEVTGGRQKVL